MSQWVLEEEKQEEEDTPYMNEDMGECPKCDCPVKRKDLAWRNGYYLDVCANCDEDEEEEKYKIENGCCVVCYVEKSTSEIGINCKTCKNPMCFGCCCEYSLANPHFDCESDETGTCAITKIPCPMCRTINIFCV